MANNVFRVSTSRKVSERTTPASRLWTGTLLKCKSGGVSQLIANEFWNITTNPLKKISVILKNAAGALVASTLVKYAIFEYDNGVPYNNAFMRLVSKGAFTTNASGVLEVLYTGIAAVGETAYVAVIHPNTTPTESMIWATTIQ